MSIDPKLLLKEEDEEVPNMTRGKLNYMVRYLSTHRNESFADASEAYYNYRERNNAAAIQSRNKKKLRVQKVFDRIEKLRKECIETLATSSTKEQARKHIARIAEELGKMSQV
jgi:hypothetical protein